MGLSPGVPPPQANAEATGDQASGDHQVVAPLDFNYQYVDANMDALYNLTGLGEASFDTDLGAAISSATEATVERLNLREVLGCPDQSYTMDSAPGEADSLYDLFMNYVV